MTENFIGITDQGKRRENNEDSFVVQRLPNDYVLACVIDGVGGYRGGEVAAAIARAVILEHVQHLEMNVCEVLQKAIAAANARIQHARTLDKDHAEMACVLTCAVTHVRSNKLWYAHVGDTRLYLLRDHSLVKLSKDHSVVGYLEDSGRLSEEDAMQHPKRNEINKALGFEDSINEVDGYIETGESPFLPGDMILLCSDGLSDMVNSTRISAILNKKISLPAKVKQLVEAANEAGGNDNITAVLVQNNKPQKKQAAYKPVDKKDDAARIAEPPLNTGPLVQKAEPLLTKSTNMILVGLLSLLLLLVLTAYLFPRKDSVDKKAGNITTSTTVEKNEKLELLLGAATDSSRSYDMAAGETLVISGAISINKDSFHLRGNGSRIVRDTAYHGPAFIIGSAAKHILLDSLVFEGFDAALAVQKNNIEMRALRFEHCKAALQYLVPAPDSGMSGRLANPIFINNKSLPKK